MKNKEEIRKEIIDLGWNALPYYERWAYPKQIWKEKKFHFKRRRKVQKWEVGYNKTIVIAMFILWLTSIFHPVFSLQTSLFFLFGFVSLALVEMVLIKRLKKINKVIELKQDLKKR